MKRGGRAWWLASLLLVATPLYATDEDLGEIVVTAPREDTPEAPPSPTAFGTVIDTTDAPTTVETLAEALSDTAGVQVRRFGGLGDFATVSVRGASPGQVRFFLDGVPLSRANEETVDLSELPLEAVERVEVFRGVTPIQFAQSGPGGAVNVVTRRAEHAPAAAASVSYGSFETRKVDVVTSAKRGAWDGLVFAHYLGSQNDYRFTLERDPTTAQDDVTTRRQNADFDGGSVTGRVGWQPTGAPWRLALTSDTFVKSQGVPGRVVDQPDVGPVPPQSDGARRDVLRQLVHLDASDVPLGRLPFTAHTGAWFVYDERHFTVPAGDPVFVHTDTTDRTIATGVQTHVRGAIGAHHLPALMIGASREGFVQRSRVPVFPTLRPGTAPERTRWFTTLAAEDEVLAFDERVAIVPALRWEWYHDDFPGDPRTVGALAEGATRDRHVVVPALGMRVRPHPAVTLLGNVGRYTRVPNLQELFGASGVVQGDPDLDVETSVNGDVGMRIAVPALGDVLDDAGLEYAYFDRAVDDLIALVPATVSIFKPVNIGSARIRGHELAARARFWRRVRLTLDYTHQDPRDTSGDPLYDGNLLPGRPADEGHARLELAWSTAQPLPGMAWLWPGRVYYDLDAIGENALERSNATIVGSRIYHGLGLEVVLPVADIRVTLAAKNLTDDQTRDALDFPLPGRALFVTVAYGFGRPR